MSEFLSNFVSYSTASVFGGLCLLNGIEGEQPVEAQVANNVAEISSSAGFTQVASVTQAEPKFVRKEIRQAKLESVVFTASGLDQTPRPAKQAKGPEGVVTGASVNLREGPGTNYTIADRARQGDKLAVTGERDGIWFEVISQNTGARVWIHGNFFSAPKDENGAILARN
ncbi:SH3 domain-containing protein [Algicella marina]|uniref:SH3 domain-containing protein n=1 Tax=Algicella marina TaxID=2683284 RepID=A0A6P1T3M6_9RHOB|nr:SH3 domain-containing protein [Algicella marina]QHQ36283.1 SH3 domain-containing protein [Algicella marina]